MAEPPGSLSLTSAPNSQAVTPAGKGVDGSPCADAQIGWNAPRASATNIQLSERLIITASGAGWPTLSRGLPGVNVPKLFGATGDGGLRARSGHGAAAIIPAAAARAATTAYPG